MKLHAHFHTVKDFALRLVSKQVQENLEMAHSTSFPGSLWWETLGTRLMAHWQPTGNVRTRIYKLTLNCLEISVDNYLTGSRICSLLVPVTIKSFQKALIAFWKSLPSCIFVNLLSLSFLYMFCLKLLDFDHLLNLLEQLCGQGFVCFCTPYLFAPGHLCLFLCEQYLWRSRKHL